MRASPLEEGDILQTGGSVGEPARWQRRVEEFVLAQIGDPPARVLEVGCGEGELARTLARAGHSVTPIDSRAPEGPIFQRVSPAREARKVLRSRSVRLRRGYPVLAPRRRPRKGPWTR